MQRRHFLHSVSATFSASLLPGLAEEAPRKKRALRKGMMTSMIRVKGTLAEKFKAVHEAGFEGVESQGGLNQQEVLDAMKSNGLVAAGIRCHTHWKDTLTHQDPATRKRGIEGAILTLKDAKVYGAGSMLLVPGVVSAEVAYDQAYKRSQECIREIIPVAKELQVRISIENVWNNFLLSPLEMARFIDEFDSPWVGSHFDIGNTLRNGWPEQWIHILGKRINRVHFKEYSVDKMNDEGLRKGLDVDFLTGSNDWKAIMTALDDVGYTGWCISEQRMGLQPDSLKKQVEAMDKMFAL